MFSPEAAEILESNLRDSVSSVVERYTGHRVLLGFLGTMRMELKNAVELQLHLSCLLRWETSVNQILKPFFNF